jgi:NADPH:quinone reductase-like Zn-dependent oxidoreductase
MSTVPTYMSAILLEGHGGPDRLEYRSDVPVPQPQPDEVLIRVSAAGINNTDINLRIGWYSAHAGASDAQESAQQRT